MSIYSSNILSVGMSVRLQKAKELRYLWMLSSLFSDRHLPLGLQGFDSYFIIFFFSRAGVLESVKYLVNVVNGEMRYNIPPEKVIIGGFSQVCSIFSSSIATL